MDKANSLFGLAAISAILYGLYALFGSQYLLAALLLLSFDNWNARTKIIDLHLFPIKKDDEDDD